MPKSGSSNEGGVATAASPASTPVDLAGRVSIAADERRRQNGIQALSRWRALVCAIADGTEPSGKQLQEIADLADTLRLPTGSLAADVAAMHQSRANAALLAEQTIMVDRAVAEGFAAAEEIPVLEARLNTLRGKIQLSSLMPRRKADIAWQAEDHLRANRRLFGELDTVAEEIAAHG